MKLIDEIKKETQSLSRTKTKGVVSDKGSTFKIDENGTTVASNELVSYKLLNDTNSSSQVSLEDKVITNRKTLKVDDIVINKHKLNPQLYELTDYKQIRNDENSAIGNLTTFSTVLVKAWEPTLKRYVLIRRLARIPIFSNQINIASSPEDMGLQDGIEKEIETIRNAGVSK